MRPKLAFPSFKSYYLTLLGQYSPNRATAQAKWMKQ